MEAGANQPDPSAKIARFTSEQRGVLLGAAVVVATMLALAVVAVTIGRDRSTTSLGDDRFQDIRAAEILTVVDDGGPVFFPDLTDGTRDIYVTHLGDDPLRGFLAFSARSPQTSCLVEWRPALTAFVDTCDETLTYTQDGSGLEQYPVELSEGKLQIDINYADRPTTGG